VTGNEYSRNLDAHSSSSRSSYWPTTTTTTKPEWHNQHHGMYAEERERERERERHTHTHTHTPVTECRRWVCVRTCVCVCERERDTYRNAQRLLFDLCSFRVYLRFYSVMLLLCSFLWQTRCKTPTNCLGGFCNWRNRRRETTGCCDKVCFTYRSGNVFIGEIQQVVDLEYIYKATTSYNSSSIRKGFLLLLSKRAIECCCW
jgi:hypothetical protein